MCKNMIKFNEYTNCFRVQIIPDREQDQRIVEVLDYCKKYDIQNVILVINAEDFHLGHMTKEEAEPWIETAKKATKVLNKNGITTSLNLWTTMGHLDRGRTLKEGQNFRLMKGIDGVELSMVACPLDKNWQDYYIVFAKYIIEELKPSVFWLEDDFRLHNHDLEKIGLFGCFCDEHIALYNKMLGTNYTREQFKNELFNSEPNKVRNLWLDVSRKTMNDLSKLIGDAIKSLNLDTQIGLMSSSFGAHCAEYRDWRTINKNFTAECGIHRLHLPSYKERQAKEYYYDFNATAMAIRSMLPDEAKIYPEMENCSYSTYNKDGRFMRFQCESASPLLLSGMTYNLFGFNGNGVNDNYGYGQEIKYYTPYMQGVLDLNVKFSSLSGVVVPIFEDIVKRKQGISNFWNMMPRCAYGASYLSALGINYQFSSDKDIKDKCVFLFNDVIDAYTDDELIGLFENNFIMIEGDALLRLYRRNLSFLLNIKNLEVTYPSQGKISMEKATYGVIVNGKTGYRASTSEHAGAWALLIDYEGDVNVYSTLNYRTDEPIKNGMVYTDKFAVVPFDMSSAVYPEIFNDLRASFFKKMAFTHTENSVISDYSAIAPFVYRENKRMTLILVNTTVQTLDKVKFKYKGKHFNSIKEVDRNGKLKEVSFAKSGEEITINESFEYFTHKTFVFE